MNEPLFTETRNGYTLTVDYDDWGSNPEENGIFKMHIWNGRFDNGLVTGKAKDEFQMESEAEWNFDTITGLAEGHLFPVTVRSYSNSDGGFYTLADNATEADGFIEMLDTDGLDQHTLEIVATSSLMEYQAWANGEVYTSYITDMDGETIDGNGDFYDLEDARQVGLETLGRLAPTHSAAAAPRASTLHL